MAYVIFEFCAKNGAHPFGVDDVGRCEKVL